MGQGPYGLLMPLFFTGVDAPWACGWRDDDGLRVDVVYREGSYEVFVNGAIRKELTLSETTRIRFDSARGVGLGPLDVHD